MYGVLFLSGWKVHVGACSLHAEPLRYAQLKVSSAVPAAATLFLYSRAMHHFIASVLPGGLHELVCLKKARCTECHCYLPLLLAVPAKSSVTRCTGC